MALPAASALAEGVQPGSAAALIPGGASAISRLVSLLRNMPDTASSTISGATILGQVAQECFQFLRSHEFRFASMQTVETALKVPRSRASFIRFWFGRRKGFPAVDQLVSIADNGAPVEVDGVGDINAALTYSNHRSIVPHSEQILKKIWDDVRFGRAFVFPRNSAAFLPGLRLSPLGVAVSPTKTRIIHDLTFIGSPGASSVNANTNFESAPKLRLGRVLRNIVWRILFLRQKFGPQARIVISKMDVAEAFRQVAVCWAGAPVFGYVFRDWVVVDRRLQFGWRNSPGFFCLFSSALQHSHSETSPRDAVVTKQGRDATQHVEVRSPMAPECPASFPSGVRTPSGSGGGERDNFFGLFYMDDAVLVEAIPESGSSSRCLQASASLASDHFRLFGERSLGDPPLLASQKVSCWDSRLEVLGWDLDTVRMTISVPPAKLARTRDLLCQWPASRSHAPETEVRSLIGKLLHLCEVVRPGKFFVGRMLNQLGLPPSQRWQDKWQGKLATSRGARESAGGRGPIWLGPEFHADVEFWRLIVAWGMRSPAGTLEAPLYSLYPQRPSYTLWSDASGDALGGYCLESGLWWRLDLNANVRARLRSCKKHRDDLSINLLELLGMVITAWVFVVQAGSRPTYARESIMMRGDNQTAVHWVTKCKGGKEPRSGALMRILGGLETCSGWCFTAAHVAGVANTLADGISRWDISSISSNLRRLRPDVCWREQVLGQAGADLCSGILAASTSTCQLRDHLDGLTRAVFGHGVLFAP